MKPSKVLVISNNDGKDFEAVESEMKSVGYELSCVELRYKSGKAFYVYVFAKLRKLKKAPK